MNIHRNIKEKNKKIITLISQNEQLKEIIIKYDELSFSMLEQMRLHNEYYEEYNKGKTYDSVAIGDVFYKQAYYNLKEKLKEIM